MKNGYKKGKRETRLTTVQAVFDYILSCRKKGMKDHLTGITLGWRTIKVKSFMKEHINKAIKPTDSIKIYPSIEILDKLGIPRYSK